VKSVGVVVADHGAAIVSVEREPEVTHRDAERMDLTETETFLVTDIERMPFDVAALARRLKEMDNPDIQWEIDADGVGGALWTVVGGPDNAQHWHLYSGRGLERQALVDELIVAVEEGRFHFTSGLTEQAAMSKAMVGYRRSVKEDGVIGSELVVALCLAIRPLPVEGWFAYA
jgi:hypothetical protein